MQIESIYYFNYSNDIGFYQSIRNFRAEKMSYIEMALSTPKARVNSSPAIFEIGIAPSNKIREFVISHLDELNEISQILAENSPKYIMISFIDDSRMYFEYNERFCNFFNVTKQYVASDKNIEQSSVSPYAIQDTTKTTHKIDSYNTHNNGKSNPSVSVKSKKQNKSLAKDIAILLAVWGPLLLIIIGGSLWRNGEFDESVMKNLFPALFFGFIMGFCALIITSNLFKNSTKTWIIATGILFIGTVIVYMLNLTTILAIELVAMAVAVCILVVLKWIAKS